MKNPKLNNIIKREESLYKRNNDIRSEFEKDFYNAIIYFISGMTDNYAIDIYNKIIKF